MRYLKPLCAVALAALSMTTSARADFVINDDLIVDGSICAGFDCVNGEVFDFDTLRLKENNLRIKFMDTSNSPFPNNDWELVANESNSGGRNFMAIRDCGTNNITGQCGNVVFAVEANAPANALYVTSAGRVGIRTSTPVLDMHVRSGNTPALRLDQDGSNGFTPQVWDIAGNETNFFIRDATGGSRLPFRVRPGAPTSAIDIASSGNVGIGTTTPSQPLHVRRANGTAQVLVEETGAVGSSTLFRITSNARPIFEFENTSLASNQGQWRASVANNGDFEINNSGVSGAIPVEFDLANNGNLTLAGTVTAPSSRAFKAGITTVDGREVLAKLDAMPIVTWHYKNQSPENRHMGPVAEDFYAAFGLGEDEQFIALNDLSGVALAAIKALSAENAELRARLESLEDRVAKN